MRDRASRGRATTRGFGQCVLASIVLALSRPPIQTLARGGGDQHPVGQGERECGQEEAEKAEGQICGPGQKDQCEASEEHDHKERPEDAVGQALHPSRWHRGEPCLLGLAERDVRRWIRTPWKHLLCDDAGGILKTSSRPVSARSPSGCEGLGDPTLSIRRTARMGPSWSKTTCARSSAISEIRSRRCGRPSPTSRGRTRNSWVTWNGCKTSPAATSASWTSTPSTERSPPTS